MLNPNIRYNFRSLTPLGSILYKPEEIEFKLEYIIEDIKYELNL